MSIVQMRKQRLGEIVTHLGWDNQDACEPEEEFQPRSLLSGGAGWGFILKFYCVSGARVLLEFVFFGA